MKSKVDLKYGNSTSVLNKSLALKANQIDPNFSSHITAAKSLLPRSKKIELRRISNDEISSFKPRNVLDNVSSHAIRENKKVRFALS